MTLRATGPALLALSLLLASCTGGTTPPTEGGTPSTGLSPYVPAENTPVGTGPDAQATLYAPLGFGDVALMNAINEFRTTGKIGGVDATAGTCVAGNFTPRVALRFNGVMHHAAYKHNLYNKDEPTTGHYQANTAVASYWGYDPVDRVTRSATTLNVANPGPVSEITGAGDRTALEAARSYALSSEHCQIMMNPAARQIGGSMVGDPTAPMPTNEELAAMTPAQRAAAFVRISSHTVVVK